MNIVQESSLGMAQRYHTDGFLFPLDAISEATAADIRADLEAAELELADEPEKLALLRLYPDRLLPSFDALIRNERLIAAAASVLGEDLMVWSAALFTKEANSPKIVSWHQDLTYWGLEPGQFSMHHGYMFHSSGPNNSDERRIGSAIRFINASTSHDDGTKALVAHVNGEDRWNHFQIAASPKARLSESDFELCGVDVVARNRIFYKGAENPL